ncbi:Hydroxyproline O-galactosyltransferase GALT6 [Camellia lanceoleosa]|nr:Hydroxyproline O-galactosyltransferase GALT6 [Camellia lanceoleosa]
MVILEVPFVLRIGFSTMTQKGLNGFFNDALSRTLELQSEEELVEKETPIRPLEVPLKDSNHQPSQSRRPERRIREYKTLSSLNFENNVKNNSTKNVFSGILKSAKEAFELGKKLLDDLKSRKAQNNVKKTTKNQFESYPYSISLSRSEFTNRGGIIVLLCRLTLGSHIIVVEKLRQAHTKHNPKISLLNDG